MGNIWCYIKLSYFVIEKKTRHGEINDYIHICIHVQGSGTEWNRYILLSRKCHYNCLSQETLENIWMSCSYYKGVIALPNATWYHIPSRKLCMSTYKKKTRGMQCWESPVCSGENVGFRVYKGIRESKEQLWPSGLSDLHSWVWVVSSIHMWPRWYPT